MRQCWYLNIGICERRPILHYSPSFSIISDSCDSKYSPFNSWLVAHHREMPLPFTLSLTLFDTAACVQAGHSCAILGKSFSLDCGKTLVSHVNKLYWNTFIKKGRRVIELSI